MAVNFVQAEARNQITSAGDGHEGTPLGHRPGLALAESHGETRSTTTDAEMKASPTDGAISLNHASLDSASNMVPLSDLPRRLQRAMVRGLPAETYGSALVSDETMDEFVQGIIHEVKQGSHVDNAAVAGPKDSEDAAEETDGAVGTSLQDIHRAVLVSQRIGDKTLEAVRELTFLTQGLPRSVSLEQGSQEHQLGSSSRDLDSNLPPSIGTQKLSEQSGTHGVPEQCTHIARATDDRVGADALTQRRRGELNSTAPTKRTRRKSLPPRRRNQEGIMIKLDGTPDLRSSWAKRKKTDIESKPNGGQADEGNTGVLPIAAASTSGPTAEIGTQTSNDGTGQLSFPHEMVMMELAQNAEGGDDEEPSVVISKVDSEGPIQVASTWKGQASISPHVKLEEKH